MAVYQVKLKIDAYFTVPHFLHKKYSDCPLSFTLCFPLYFAGLRMLNVSHNHLRGTFPPFEGAVPGAGEHLEVLNISHNEFTGPLPVSLSSCPKLWYVGAEMNFLAGAVPNMPSLGAQDADRQIEKDAFVANWLQQGLDADRAGVVFEQTHPKRYLVLTPQRYGDYCNGPLPPEYNQQPGA
jgi:hypothetical protein